mmetsp:Transcript_28720/g.27634  ORF Transcript_28720/g.27634 Transcript_28720/m.27634 type:complete len:174 (-) Transcript_28720:105-626(-)
MMLNENTPLTKDNLAKASETMSKAGDFIKGQASGLAASADGGNSMPLRILAILGGGAMVISSVLSLFGKAITFDLMGFFMEVVCIWLGGIIVLLEISDKLSATSFEEFIHARCEFLETTTGKGFLYGISGILRILQINLINLVVGLFMCFLGAVFYIVGSKKSGYEKMVSIAV